MDDSTMVQEDSELQIPVQKERSVKSLTLSYRTTYRKLHVLRTLGHACNVRPSRTTKNIKENVEAQYKGNKVLIKVILQPQDPVCKCLFFEKPTDRQRSTAVASRKPQRKDKLLTIRGSALNTRREEMTTARITPNDRSAVVGR